MANLETVFQGGTFEVIIDERWRAANTPQPQPSDDKFRLVSQVECNELVGPHTLREEPLRVSNCKSTSLRPRIAALTGPDTSRIRVLLHGGFENIP